MPVSNHNMCQSEKDFFFSPLFSWVKNQNGLPINLDGIRLGLSSSEIVRWWKFPSNVRTLPHLGLRLS